MDPLHRMPEFYVFLVLLLGFCVCAPRILELDGALDYLNRSNAIIELRRAGIIE